MLLTTKDYSTIPPALARGIVKIISSFYLFFVIILMISSSLVPGLIS